MRTKKPNEFIAICIALTMLSFFFVFIWYEVLSSRQIMMNFRDKSNTSDYNYCSYVDSFIRDMMNILERLLSQKHRLES